MIRERLNTREAGDLLDELNAHRLRVNYGPHLVRVTRQDMQAWMPDVRPAQPLALEPDAALRRAARRDPPRRPRGLPAAARRCCASCRSSSPAAALHRRRWPSSPRVQGVVLGNVGVYVDASVDPETLTPLARPRSPRRSSARGSCAEAMRGGGDGLPLLRGITAQTIAGVAGEEQVLVFAERVRCLRQLAAHPARAPRRRGPRRRRLASTGREFEALKQRFAAGEFPVLCLGAVGHEGHNLQNASVLVPPRPAVAARPASSSASGAPPGPAPRAAAVQTYIPYIRGGGHRARRLACSPRAAPSTTRSSTPSKASAPPSRRSPPSSAQITGQVADSKDQAGYAATAARLRVAAAVFGA